MTFEIEHTTTVEEIKRKVNALHHDVSVANQRLMINGQQMEDERTAQDYQLRRDSEVTLVLVAVPDGNVAQTAQVYMLLFFFFFFFPRLLAAHQLVLAPVCAVSAQLQFVPARLWRT